ncbi:MAG: sensor histidine kinase [Oculatellaceae cyanobacterium Prado106]|jgi:two-component sensor histidine kinase|nr:sensor histidine kinase [Oculatellaceae cyanobacterium Prado106]
MPDKIQTSEQITQVQEQLWQTLMQFGDFSAVQERNRIARDLHDSLGYALTSLNIQLQTAIKLWQLDPNQAQRFLTEAHRLGGLAMQEVRQSVKTLREDHLESQPLNERIAELLHAFRATTHIHLNVQIESPLLLPTPMQTPIYRIIQEALNNICKYAKATQVSLQLSTTATTVHLIVQDNGQGFNLAIAPSGFGLQGIQERVTLLRGHVQIQSQPGAGCRIEVKLPLQTLDNPSLGIQSPLPSPLQDSISIGVWEPFDLQAIAPSEADDFPYQALPSQGWDVELPIESPLQPHPEPYSQHPNFWLPLPESQDLTLPNPEIPTDFQSFIQSCEPILTELLGPIATLLIQRAATLTPTHPEEWIEAIATQIPDPELSLELTTQLHQFQPNSTAKL